MGSSCWGAPQHELTPRVSRKFPDLRVQYRGLASGLSRKLGRQASTACDDEQKNGNHRVRVRLGVDVLGSEGP